MKRKRMISKIGKHSNFFAKRKLNYLWPLKLTVYFLLTLSTIFVPILVNSVFIDTKHTLRYDGEVNIGKLISIIFRTKLLYFNKHGISIHENHTTVFIAQYVTIDSTSFVRDIYVFWILFVYL